MNIPSDLFYTEEHEWARIENDVAVIGITDHAQDQLGDIVHIEMPAIGDELMERDSIGVIESVKAVSDLYSPLNGEVIEINKDVEDDPSLVNQDPYGDGWLFKLRLQEEGAQETLLAADDYENILA